MLNNKPCILIADDEPNICRIAKLIISSDDFDVLTAENGQDAYEKAIKFKPALVFSDILMPKCDGFELCSKIKANPSTAHIPFIFLTGLDEKQFKSRLSEVHADDYLTKPFSSQDMKDKIQRWVKKPIIHSEEAIVPFPKASVQERSEHIDFGITQLDDQLNGSLLPESFVFVYGPIGSGKSTLGRQFILDGIQKEQSSLFISFESSKKSMDPLFGLSDQQQRYLQFTDASNWTHINSAPWRNIDYLFDFMFAECEKRSFKRIVIDSISHGLAFWSLQDLTKFVDLCRSLPNANQQSVLFLMDAHSQFESLQYHLQQMMDIGISTSRTTEGFDATIAFSKWQPLAEKNQPLVKTTAIN